MRETVIASVTRSYPGDIAGEHPASAFKITAEATKLSGNEHPHFSVTAETRNGGGCMHREILLAWPELKPLVDLHLANGDNGQPMHAEANGWYWMAGSLGGAGEQYHGGNSDMQHWKPDGSFDGYRHSTPDESLKVCADHLRISLDQARDLREQCRAAIDRKPESVGYKKACAKARAIFRAFVEAQGDRWRNEAAAGVALIRSLQADGSPSAEEIAAARRRVREVEQQGKADTLAGVPVPPAGVFKLSHVAEIILPHPFVITARHMRGDGNTLNPDAAPCGYPGCSLKHTEHERQKTLFISIPKAMQRNLNDVPSLAEYLSGNKATFEALGIQGFAFPALPC